MRRHRENTDTNLWNQEQKHFAVKLPHVFSWLWKQTLCSNRPLTVIKIVPKCNAFTIIYWQGDFFALSNAKIVGSNSTRGMDVYKFFVLFYVLSSVGS
jgi:hypothetical protein